MKPFKRFSEGVVATQNMPAHIEVYTNLLCVVYSYGGLLPYFLVLPPYIPERMAFSQNVYPLLHCPCQIAIVSHKSNSGAWCY